jgi:hypothetical protein
MIRFKRTTHLTLWVGVLVAFSVASRNALSASSLMSASWEVDAESWYAGGARTRGGGGNIGSVDEWSTDLKWVISPQVTKNLLLRLGAEWQRLSFGVSDHAVVPNVLQKVNALIGLDYQLTDQWLLRADLQPGVYSDFQDVSWRDVDAPLLMGAAYLVNSDLQWFFGVRVDLRSQYPALPALGVRWRFADQWTLNLMLPNPQLEYDLSDKLKAYLSIGAEFGTFTVGDHFGSDRGRPDLNHAVLDYFEVRVGPGVAWKIRPSVTLEAEGGCMVYRRFDFFDQDRVLRSDPAPYVRVLCHIQF